MGRSARLRRAPHRLRAASVGNRAPPHGGGASGGVVSFASEDDGGGSQARCASSSKEGAGKFAGMTVAVDDDVFASLVEPLRRELTVHCYRMAGSIHDAEDLVQETYLRAWRGFHSFENRSSVRTWMYRIATNVCLTALDGRARRPMPTGFGQPSSDPYGALDPRPEVTWLEPVPDSVVWGGSADDPAAEVVDRESVRLAFIAALQHLTPPQRAILILRDVLAWQASEVAALLNMSTAALRSRMGRSIAANTTYRYASCGNGIGRESSYYPKPVRPRSRRC